MYALKPDRQYLSQLRSLQELYLKYDMTGVSGVAEVASIGGFVRQYQVTVDPNKLRAYDIPISKIRMAVQRSNNDDGGRLLEAGEKEFMIRGLGYLKSVGDIREIAMGVDRQGTPILIRDVADVSLGPETRRGLAGGTGEGEAVGGVIGARAGGLWRGQSRGGAGVALGRALLVRLDASWRAAKVNPAGALRYE